MEQLGDNPVKCFLIGALLVLKVQHGHHVVPETQNDNQQHERKVFSSGLFSSSKPSNLFPEASGLRASSSSEVQTPRPTGRNEHVTSESSVKGESPPFKGNCRESATAKSGSVPERGAERWKYRSSVDAREPHNPIKSEEHQRHLQGVLYIV
eukprot:283657-Prorocentrum_minimum.AAC.1